MGESLDKGIFDEYVKRMEGEHKVLHKRVKKIEEQMSEIHDISINVAKLATNMENMIDELAAQRKEQEAQDKRIDAIEGRDGEMWRKLVGYVITCVAGILVGFIFKQIGM